MAMRFRSLKALCLASTAAAGVLVGVPAVAQTGDTETIIVTAQRRAERLQDVPITIANVDAEAMRRNNVTMLSDIGKVTAGLRFDQRSSFSTPSIRGVSTSIIFAGGGSLIGVYLDNFYSPALMATDIQLMNVSNVSVLKGPQGTLFGRNVTGGAIQITTDKPSSQTKAIVEAAYGSYNSQRYQGYVTTGITDRVAADLAVSLSKGDGYVTNIANGDEKAGRYRNFSLRGGVNFEISDTFSALFRYSHVDKSDPTGIVQQVYVLNGLPLCVTCTNQAAAGALTATQRGTTAADEPLSFKYSSDAYQLTLNWDIGFANLASYTQYRKDRGLQIYSLDYTNVGGLALSIHDLNKTVSQELLMTSKPGSRLQWTAGVFYFDWRSDFAYVGQSFVRNPTFPYPLGSRSGATNQSMAVYGEGVYEVADGLFVTAGLRYTHDNFKDGFYQFGGYTAPQNFPPDLKTSAVTPRGVIRYQLDENSSVYASVSKGYKGAIRNVGGASSARIEPESLWAYEVGYKNGGRDLTFNVSGYYYDYKNQQLQQSRFVPGTTTTATIITNAASSEMYGIDAEVHYNVTEDFKVNISGAWSHARYKRFPGAPAIIVNTNAAGQVISTPPTLVDASGRPMSKAPDWSGNIGASYTFRDSIGGGSLQLSGNLYYTSKIYFDLSAQIPQKAYALLDLRAEWTDPTDRFSVAVSGKNVTDTAYYVQAGTNVFGVSGLYGPPAMVEGSLRIKF